MATVSFQAPLVLLALLAVPALAALYVWVQRRPRPYAVRYPAMPVLTGVLPRRGGWRRHAPPVLFLLALAALVAALARPEATIGVERERAAIVLATDTSGSMQATDVSPDRMTAIKRAGQDFLRAVPERVGVGLVSFGSAAQTLQTPTLDRAAVRRSLLALEPGGGTATGDALAAALRSLRPNPRDRSPAAIVLMSDGKQTKGVDAVTAADSARRLGVRVFTIALGTPTGSIEVRRASGGTRRQAVPPDSSTLQQIATRTGGRFFEAPTAENLETIYARLGSSVVSEPERQQITAGFAGGALGLVLLGGVLSVLWAGRLP